MISSSFSQNTVFKVYDESSEIIANPERGFSEYRAAPVTIGLINELKQNHVTVIQRIYTIPQFNNSALSQDFLNLVQADLNTAREGGVKLVLRFSYTDNQNGADAPLDIILLQIEQLKPIFQSNYDVIVYIEAGFIGAWGEWYYSSNLLNNTEDRRTVLYALLDALPEQRCVVVRTPDYKRKIFEDNIPISLSTAFDGSYKSRTGAHNDCFLASSTDFGTYLSNDIEGDKNYLNQDNMFVPQGGETCNPSSYTGCDNSQSDLERMHWSVLNQAYHPTVLDGWETEGCYSDIQKHLGYRLVLLNSEVSNQVKPGGKFTLSLNIENKGYANPFNPRSLEVILRNVASKKKYKALTNIDPRFWFSGDTTKVYIEAGIPENMQEGNYELFINLADTEEKLHDRAEYSIRLANENMWEDSTGYNCLLVEVEVDSSNSGEGYSGNNYFTLISTSNNNQTSITIDGLFDDWSEVEQIDLSPNEELVGDNPIASADIVDIWITDDEENVYISYTLDSSYANNLFYHIFFDLDNNSSTGFHSAESYAGIDLMIENDQMWRYTGTNGEWSWESYGYFSFAPGTSESHRVEYSISKSLLNSNIYNSVNFILNVNDNDENVDDDYAPNSYQLNSYAYNYLVTSVNKTTELLPTQIQIDAYPNPFNGIVNISFHGNTSEIEEAIIYDMLGRNIYSFNKDEFDYNKVTWYANNNFNDKVSSGIYLFVLKSKKHFISKKIVLLK